MRKEKQRAKWLRNEAEERLRSLPSHRDSGPVHAPLWAPAHLVAKRCIAAGLIFLALCVLGLGALIASGNLTPIFQEPAQRAFFSALPKNMTAQLGDTQVRLLWPLRLGVSYSDVSVFRADGSKFVQADDVTLALKPTSLASDKIEFSSLKLSGMHFNIEGGEEGALPKLQIDELQQYLTDFSTQIIKDGGEFLTQKDKLAIRLEDVEFKLPENDYSDVISVKAFEVTSQNGKAVFTGTIFADGYEVPLYGEVLLTADEGAEKLNFSIQSERLPLPWRRLQTLVSDDPLDNVPGMRQKPLLGDTALEFEYSGGSASDYIRINIVPQDMAFKLDAGDFVPATGQLAITSDFATKALTIQRSFWQIGKSSFVLNGRVRDAYNVAGKNSYEFDILANRGTAIASDAPTSPVRFAARARGIGKVDDQIIQFSTIEIDSDNGAASGQGEFTLAGDYQTAIFDVLISDMTIRGIKQFWPAPVARSARRWVLDNLAGGRVVDGTFNIAEPLRRRIDGTELEFTGATTVDLNVEGVRFDVTGEIPPVRDADGHINYADGITIITLSKGTLYLPSGKTADAKDATLIIPRSDPTTDLILADLNLGVTGNAAAIGELISFAPINAERFYPFNPSDLEGDIEGRVAVKFSLNGRFSEQEPDWSVDFNVKNGGSKSKFEGRNLDGLDGNIQADTERAIVNLEGNVDGLPARIKMVLPFGDSEVKAEREIVLQLNDKDRQKVAPGLDIILSGLTIANVETVGSSNLIAVDLTPAKLSLPWVGWAKGEGIASKATFNMKQSGSAISLSDFKLTGQSFAALGRFDIDEQGLKTARLSNVKLNEGDSFALSLKRAGKGYQVNIDGKSMDVRAIIRHARVQARNENGTSGSTPVDLTAKIEKLTGFHGETMSKAVIELKVRNGAVTRFSLKGNTKSGFPVQLNLDGAGSERVIEMEALAAGEFLRFGDIYTNVRGGKLTVSLKGSGADVLSGTAVLNDFRVFNEPKLAQLVQSKPSGSQSLEQAVNKRIDTREVKFEKASSRLVFKPGRLDIAEAVARGPLAGFTIQGMVFDSKNQTRLTGTFLPAYGLNSLFAKIPILGLLLGNGRDRGLIGVTFKLSGSFDSPTVTVNPLSVIAPGIFRSIFEFR